MEDLEKRLEDLGLERTDVGKDGRRLFLGVQYDKGRRNHFWFDTSQNRVFIDYLENLDILSQYITPLSVNNHQS